MGPRPCLGVACTSRKAARAQHQVGRGRDSSSGSCPAWARLKVGDDRYGPPVGDREWGEVEWAAAGPEECGAAAHYGAKRWLAKEMRVDRRTSADGLGLGQAELFG
jgi:hypothetical protein